MQHQEDLFIDTAYKRNNYLLPILVVVFKRWQLQIIYFNACVVTKQVSVFFQWVL